MCHKGIKIGETPPPSSVEYFEADRLEEVLRRFISGEEIPPQEFHFAPALEQAKSRIFKQVDAAGGIVSDRAGRVLLIHRYGRWDLPKGKMEKKESMEETAVREVMEECGLQSAPVVLYFLTNSWHIYSTGKGLVLKKTAWFTMSYDGPEALTPQHEEGISRACWRERSSLSKVISDTYPSLREVFMLAGLVNS